MNATKSSTPPKAKKPKKSSPATDSSDDVQAQLLSKLMKLLKPSLDFHEPVDGATTDDLRLFWDVRLVRGEDTPFKHLQGSSTLTGMLGEKMVANASSTIQREIHNKILEPLVMAMQSAAEDPIFEAFAEQERSNDFCTEEESFGEGDDKASPVPNSAPQHGE